MIMPDIFKMKSRAADHYMKELVRSVSMSKK